MTIHGALQLLGLPTTPGEAMTLQPIRDAFREQAMNNHPDAGGSTETMRRLNEAYQLLKERYRSRGRENPARRHLGLDLIQDLNLV